MLSFRLFLAVALAALILPSSAKLSLIDNSFQYSTEYTDRESNLQYLDKRYLKLGLISLFTTHDILESDEKQLFDNDYNYAAGDPINEDDPSGESGIETNMPGLESNALEIEQSINYSRSVSVSRYKGEPPSNIREISDSMGISLAENSSTYDDGEALKRIIDPASGKEIATLEDIRVAQFKLIKTLPRKKLNDRVLEETVFKDKPFSHDAAKIELYQSKSENYFKIKLFTAEEQATLKEEEFIFSKFELKLVKTFNKLNKVDTMCTIL